MASIYSISTIRRKVREYGKRIHAPRNLLTVRTISDGFGTPHIEIDEKGYNYVVSERGKEYNRKHTKDLNKLLYWIFELIVFQMANEYELENRKPNKDFRRILFTKEIELMKRLDLQWARWKKKEIDKVLSEHPYEDDDVKG